MLTAVVLNTWRLSGNGGFSGSDPAATVASVAAMVEKGDVRYFLTGDGFGRGRFGGFGRGGTAAQIIQTVQTVCTPVHADAPKGKASLPSAYARQLYDCAARSPTLAAQSS